MDCLLKVIVWLKDQRKPGAFDRFRRSYFFSAETLPKRIRMQVGRTPMDCALKVEATGYVPGSNGQRTGDRVWPASALPINYRLFILNVGRARVVAAAALPPPRSLEPPPRSLENAYAP